MGTIKLANKEKPELLTIDELCKILKCTKSWVHQRTGPKARRFPRIPTIEGMKPLHFHPEDIEELFFVRNKERSLKIKKVEENVMVSNFAKGKYEPLW